MNYLPKSAPDSARHYRIEYMIGGSVVSSRDIGSRTDTVYHSKRVASRMADLAKKICTVYVYKYSQPGVCLSASGPVFSFHAEPLAK